MTFLTYIDDRVDIYVIPSVQYPLWGRPGDEIVLGDLHANTMKLIYALTRHGVICGMTTDKYNSLVQICKKSVAHLSKLDLHEFHQILNSFPYNKATTIHLLGNELGSVTDSCDVLTMIVIKILKQNHVQIQISLSSRTCHMVEACELKTGLEFLSQNSIFMRGVHEVIQKELMTTEEILALYNGFYKSALRINSRIYDVNSEGKPIVYLLNHAGVDLVNIQRQTEYLMNEPLPNNPTLKEFNQTLDANDKTFRAILAGNLVNQLRDPNRENPDVVRYPFEAPITDEQGDNQEFCQEQRDFQLRYIHSNGQIDYENPHACALNSDLGYARDNHIGKYVIGYKTSHNLPSEFVEKYDIYNGSEVRKLRLARQQTRINFSGMTPIDSEPFNSKVCVFAQETVSQVNTGRSTCKPLSRARGGILVFNGTGRSPGLLSFQGVYESPKEIINEVERGYSIPQEELRLDSNPSLSHSQYTVRDSLQSTTVVKSEQTRFSSKTSFGSPIFSFYDDDDVEHESPVHSNAAENKGP